MRDLSYCIENDFAAQREMEAVESERIGEVRYDLAEAKNTIRKTRSALELAYAILVKLETEGVGDNEYAAAIIQIEEALNLPPK